MKDKELTVIQDEATALIAQAIDKGVNVDVMERLLAMRATLRAEKAKEEFDKAMSGFQADCPIIEKTKKVDFTSQRTGRRTQYNYAPIEAIVSQVKEILEKYGFSYSFNTKINGQLLVICKVTHKEGHSESSEFSLPIDTGSSMNMQQQVASALTYAKRYTFCNSFGIMTGEDDDDAQSAPQPETMTPRQMAEQKEQKPEAGVNTDDHFCTIHQKQMKERFAQNGGHYWDHRWQDENHQWQKCPGITPKKTHAQDQGEFYPPPPDYE